MKRRAHTPPTRRSRPITTYLIDMSNLKDVDFADLKFVIKERTEAVGGGEYR